MNEQSIINCDIPAWYELSLSVRGDAFIVAIHPEAFYFIEHGIDWRNSPMIWLIKKHLQLEDFVQFNSSGMPAFGFGGIGGDRISSNLDHWICLRFTFPTIGQGGSAFEVREQIISKTTSVISSNLEINSIRATLYLLFETLNQFSWGRTQKKPEHKKLQLMTVDQISVLKEGFGFVGFISASVSKKLAQWLKTCDESGLDHGISGDMALAEEKMWPPGLGPKVFSATKSVNDPRLIHLHMVGGGMDPNSSGWSYGREDLGYELRSHNSETPLSQLTLLAGLASLHMLAREGGC